MRIMSDKAIVREEVQDMVDAACQRGVQAFKFAAISLAVSATALVVAIVALVR